MLRISFNMLKHLAILTFLVALVTCGSRTQTPDGDEPYYGQGGSYQGQGGTGISVTGGNGNASGSTGVITSCGSIECPAGSVCCASCGICVSPDLPCPDCPGGAGGGFVGTGGTVYPGTGGFYPGTGTGGASVGTGGSQCLPPRLCASELQTGCPSNDACGCNSCSCQAQGCAGNPGCLSIYRCLASTNCTNPGECFQRCGPVIMPNIPFFADAMNLQSCVMSTGCPRCAVPVPIPTPAFDAGIGFCSPPPPTFRTVECSGGVDAASCWQSCNDGQTKYFAQCANGSCSCNYEGKEICRCPYSSQSGCYSCCPAWGSVGLE